MNGALVCEQQQSPLFQIGIYKCRACSFRIYERANSCLCCIDIIVIFILLDTVYQWQRRHDDNNIPINAKIVLELQLLSWRNIIFRNNIQVCRLNLFRDSTSTGFSTSRNHLHKPDTGRRFIWLCYIFGRNWQVHTYIFDLCQTTWVYMIY